MWTIIILIVAGIIIWAIVSNNSDNEKIRQDINSTGGLKAKYPNFVKLLEDKFKMKLKFDDGRKFCYKNNISSGELNIGLKLEIDNSLVIFSELIKNNGTVKKGKNVTFYAFADNNANEKAINLSIEDLADIVNKPQGKYLNEWKNIISTIGNEEYIKEHVNSLYIKDNINPEMFSANYYYKTMRFHPEEKQSESMNEIHYSPPAFTDLFMSAYPDVYLWAQKNLENVKIYEELENNPNTADDHFQYIENLIPFYRSLINQYKEEGNKLECA